MRVSACVFCFLLTQILQESGVLEAAFFYDQEGKLIESFVDDDVSVFFTILVPIDTVDRVTSDTSVR